MRSKLLNWLFLKSLLIYRFPSHSFPCINLLNKPDNFSCGQTHILEFAECIYIWERFLRVKSEALVRTWPGGVKGDTLWTQTDVGLNPQTGII